MERQVLFGLRQHRQALYWLAELRTSSSHEESGSASARGGNLVLLLAMGFVSPVQSVLDAFAAQRDARGNARARVDGEHAYRTSVPKVFAAGDMRRGRSLVVWAVS